MKFFLIVLMLATVLLAKDYRGAEYRTKAAYTYGRIEVRMKSAQASGMLSSLFTYHENTGADSWNELDIEIMGRYNNEVQFNAITPGRVDHVERHVVPYNPHADFHEYAIEWTPHYLAWSIDGAEVYRQTGTHVLTLDRAQKIMMNVWPPLYPDWAGTLDPENLPLYAFYDWIRYYRYTPGENDNFTLLWEDNFDSFDAVRWEKATHTFDGNNADFIQNNVVFQDGYLILCLTRPSPTGYSGAAIEDVDVSKPWVHGAFFIDDTIYVRFSDALDPVTAQQPANYLIPGLTVESVEADGPLVRLYTSGRDPEINYNLIVLNVADDAGNVIDLANVVVASAPQESFFINAGGSVEGAYVADQEWRYTKAFGYGGGTAVEQSLAIANTDNDAVFASEVRGIGFYDIRLPNGSYNVKLLFSENQYSSSGQRVFDVYAENNLYLDDLDIVAEAGSKSALTKTLSGVQVKDNRLTLAFVAETGVATLSGIELERVVSDLPEPRSNLPLDFEMSAYPNPFNPSARLNFVNPRSQQVTARITNIKGQVVSLLHDGPLPAGKQIWTLDGNGLPSGIYFFSVMAEGDSRSVKMMLLR